MSNQPPISLLYQNLDLGLSLDLSRSGLTETDFDNLTSAFEKAFAAMADLEAGAIANPDENRQVGHYWLRTPELAPDEATQTDIQRVWKDIKSLAVDVDSEKLKGEGGRFENLLIVGIGGSALGPQLVTHALAVEQEPALKPYFFDNTDPDGMQRVVAALKNQLGQTLVLVVSKSGGTPETRNGMLEIQAAYKAAGLDFGKHAVAITGSGSKLDKTALQEKWLKRFPMWDWVGGRTSVTGPVGLVPMALAGLDWESFLKGASAVDKLTTNSNLHSNPAALLAAYWYVATNGKGEKDMVVLPYKDSLELFSKYLQQLVMESLGKEKDLDGNTVFQGIAVYGNKGSTDQHAYVQQLREGVSNFFVTFIQVLEDLDGNSAGIEVEEGITSGDYLLGFLLGTQEALTEMNRPSAMLTIPRVNAFYLGGLIALYERAVGLYANLVNINAYHQPGVEAGKKAAAKLLELQKNVVTTLRNNGSAMTAAELAQALGEPDSEQSIYKICEHLAANKRLSTPEGLSKTAKFKA